MGSFAKLLSQHDLHVADVRLSQPHRPPAVVLYRDPTDTQRVFVRSGQEPGWPYESSSRLIYREADSLETFVAPHMQSDDPHAEG